MDFFRRIFKSVNFWPLVAVLFVAILAGRTLISESGYFNMHDDLQMMRQLEMEKCFKDGQIPCRWVPDMGYGYGFPLFNFYPPLPYLTGQVFRILNFSFVDTAKLLFALSFVLSGLAMYFLAKEFFGKWGGVLSSAFYVWAPYHSVDIYVRGAMNEAWALIWFPLILWTSYKLITENKKYAKWIVSLSLSWAGLLLSHNLMVMIFTPVFAVWCLIFWLKERDLKKIPELFFSGLTALGFSAFFTLPAIFEQRFVHVDTLTQGYYEYIAHFATIGQLLFSRFWGYGPSIWGPDDGMPYQIGQLHWILSLFVLLFTVLVIFKKIKIKTETKALYAILFAVGLGWFAAFMTHQNSTFIWQKIHTLSFVQFPWRFLTLVIFGFSFAAGSIFVFLPQKKAGVLGGLLVVLLIALNWNYFLPQGGRMGSLTDEQKFTGKAWDLQRTAGIFDYLPETAKENPKDPPAGLAEIFSGSGSIKDASQGTNWAKFTGDLAKDSVVRIDLYQFPNWEVTIDGKATQTYISETEKWGRMYINVPKGNHSIFLKLTNTPLRTVSNYFSLFSWTLLVLYLVLGRRIFNGKLA